jgi:hypothetical protein
MVLSGNWHPLIDVEIKDMQFANLGSDFSDGFDLENSIGFWVSAAYSISHVLNEACSTVFTLYIVYFLLEVLKLEAFLVA